MQTCCDPAHPCLWGAAAGAAAGAACCRLFRGQHNPSSTRLSMPPDCRMDIMANVLLAAGASPAMVRRRNAPRPAVACAPARLPFWRNAAALAMALSVGCVGALQPPARNAVTHGMPWAAALPACTLHPGLACLSRAAASRAACTCHNLLARRLTRLARWKTLWALPRPCSSMWARCRTM